jgi:hypothetical protein
MKRSGLGRYALTIGAAAAFLAGCGGSQPLIDAPSATQQRPAIVTADRGGSRLLPQTKGTDLLYVSGDSTNKVYVYSYPKGKLVGKISGVSHPGGECVDQAGDVFVVTGSPSASNEVYEFAHGGTSPMAILSNPGYGSSCSVDSKTGNLAVANIDDPSNPSAHGDIAIYTAAQGQPTMYSSSQFLAFGSCGYDNEGNLYVEGSTTGSGEPIELALLSRGSSSLEMLQLNKSVYAGYLFWPAVEWDGTNMTISTVPHPEGRKASGVVSVYQLSISGTNADVIGTTELVFKKNRHRGQTWIYGGSIIGADSYKDGNVSTWSYPRGGKPNQTIEKIPDIELMGVTVSHKQSR